MSVSEWAEQYRILSTQETSSPGPWRNDRNPFLIEPMLSLTDPTIHEIVMLAARQMGKSSVFLNYIGWTICINPLPMIMVQPTGDLAEKFSLERISPMFRDSPCFRGLVPDDKSRDSANKILHKQGVGWYLIITGANSTSGIISMPVPILIFDEIDQYPRDLFRQGDVISIAEKMQTNFPNYKTLVASTPTIKDESRIESAYRESTQERWTHQCPICGKWSQFGLRGYDKPDRIVWQTRLDFETMMMICPHCKTGHTRNEWNKGGGKYIADNPGHKIRGFHVNAFDHVAVQWESIVEEWRKANEAAEYGDFSLMTTFINSRLAEVWERKGEVVESHVLEERREIYNAEIPDGVCVLTMGIDVQDNRLAYEVVGWGLGYESWGIEYAELFGDPRQGVVWNQIDDLLNRTWLYANGNHIKISRAAVDTGGHMTPEVYRYCKARQSRGVYPIKGIGGGDKLPLTRPSKKSPEKGLFIVGVDGIKTDLMSWLKINVSRPGYCHFPKDIKGSKDIAIKGYDANYFDMLTSETKISVKNKNGFDVFQWHKPAGKRNESLDCRVYARAALRIMSPKDDVLLNRIFMTEPWAASPVQMGKNTVNERNGMSTKKNKPVSKNAKARAKGIEL